jgi:hypothetical protein
MPAWRAVRLPPPPAVHASRGAAPDPGAALALQMDMAWRTAGGPAARASGEARGLETGAVPAGPGASRAHQAAGAEAALPGQRVPAPLVMALHPAVVESLVQDVLRRAEKRMRIERERRGL